MHILKSQYIFYFYILLSFNLLAEPWIDTSNLYLRENIQRLADSGHIKTPVTSYPLMWIDIAHDLKKIHYSSLTSSEKQAYDFINFQYQKAKKSYKRLELNLATQEKRFNSYGESHISQNNIKFHNSIMFDNVAIKLSSHYAFSTHESSKTNFSGSYIAGFIGNWAISAGKQDRWWGPGWDSNLALTNNARAIPAISLSRRSAIPFNIPYTDIDIPWTVTSFLGVMDDERVIKNTLLWGFRLNFKPFKNLEIGLTRLAQWGGDGRSRSLKTFSNVLLGKDNCGAGGLDCGDNKENEPGNQQAGYDFRYSFNLFNTPLAFYGQSLAEDGNDNSTLSFLTEIQSQLGLDAHINLFNMPSTVFIEYADTYTDCVDEDTIDIGNCFYEHHIYQTGMRYKKRTLGNLYDNDTKSIVLGIISSINTDTKMTNKLRYLDLNKDDSDKAPASDIIGNPLTKVSEEILMISSQFQYSYKNWRYTAGVDLSKSTFNGGDNKNNINVTLKIESNL